MQKFHNRAVAHRAILLAAGSAALGLSASMASATAVSTATWSNGGSGSTATTQLWSAASNWSNADGTGATSAIPGTDQNVDIVDGSSLVQYYNFAGSGFTASYTTSGALIIASGNTLRIDHNQPLLELDGGLASNATTGAQINGYDADTGLYNAGTINCDALGAGFTLELGGGASQSTAYSTNSGTIEATLGGQVRLYQSQSAGGINNTGGTIQAIGTASLHSILAITAADAPKITGGTVNVDQYSTLTTSGSNMSWALSGVTLTTAGSLTSIESNAGGSSYSAIEMQNGSSFSNSGTATFEFNGTNSVAMSGLVIGSSTLDTTHFLVDASTTPDASTFANSGNLYFLNEAAGTSLTTGAATEFDLNTSGTVTNNGNIYFTTTNVGETGGKTWLRLGSSATIGGAGSLIFNDSASNYVGTMNGTTGTPTLTLGAGQTLTGAVDLGNGQIGIINNGTIHATGVNPIVISTAGGDSFTNNGTLAVNDNSKINDTDTSGLTFATGSTLSVVIDSNDMSSGQLDVTGALNLGSGSAYLSVSDLGSTALTPGAVFTLIDPGSTSGYFNGLSQGSIFAVGDNSFQISYTGGVGDDDLTLTAVATPEPASGVLLALGALTLLRRRRTA